MARENVSFTRYYYKVLIGGGGGGWGGVGGTLASAGSNYHQKS